MGMNTAQLKGLRDMATKNPYPFTLSFTREFTAGTLAGLTHDDSIGFCRASDGDEWVSSVNRANKDGKIDYKVIKWSVTRTLCFPTAESTRARCVQVA
jgi:hypothetical protein